MHPLLALAPFAFVVLGTLVHEIGHAVACLLVRGRPEIRMWAGPSSPIALGGPIPVRVGISGPHCRCENLGTPLPAGPRLLAFALGGPIASGVLVVVVLLSLPLTTMPVILLSIALAQAIGNLIPMGSGDHVSDGRHVVESLRAIRRTPGLHANEGR